MITIREERQEDIPAIRCVNELAFGQVEEADLVERLRRHHKLLVSLIAEDQGRLVGHIAFSRVTLGSQRLPSDGAGLGPMAVLPDRQKRGVGSLLARQCRTRAAGPR